MRAIRAPLLTGIMLGLASLLLLQALDRTDRWTASLPVDRGVE